LSASIRANFHSRPLLDQLLASDAGFDLLVPLRVDEAGLVVIRDMLRASAFLVGVDARDEIG
jgi:hypothetical protein